MCDYLYSEMRTNHSTLQRNHTKTFQPSQNQFTGMKTFQSSASSPTHRSQSSEPRVSACTPSLLASPPCSADMTAFVRCVVKNSPLCFSLGYELSSLLIAVILHYVQQRLHLQLHQDLSVLLCSSLPSLFSYPISTKSKTLPRRTPKTAAPALSSMAVSAFLPRFRDCWTAQTWDRFVHRPKNCSAGPCWASIRTSRSDRAAERCREGTARSDSPR